MTLSQYLSMTGQTQTEFAVCIGVTPMSVSRYASGARIPKRDVMQRIAKTTKGKVTADDFFAAQPEPMRRAS